MKIISLKLADNTRKWQLDEVFFNKLTLLVGASGVGKTQILKAIHHLKKIAEGHSLNGIEWNVCIETLDKQRYNWMGAFETKDNSIFNVEENALREPKIIYEKLLLNNVEEIIDRNFDKIIFCGNPIIKLSQETSVVHLLKQEDVIKPLFDGIIKIQFNDQSNSVNSPNELLYPLLYPRLLVANKLSKKYNTLTKIQESNEQIIIKLFLASKFAKKTFQIIKDRFCAIFPQVEDIKIAPLKTISKNIPDVLKDFVVLQIKEQKIDVWIEQPNISSGMLRTLIHISELYLCSEETIFLIDEFENSLGINCINEITNDILKSNRQIQFIITSHHPYIINSIHYNNWKLVTRNAGIVKTHDVKKFNIGKSKHEAFMQLIQLDEYQTGSEQP